MDQLIANLANAQHSTGPKTEKGKHRTRLNAYRHGLTGQIRLLTAEENEAFELHCAGIRESLQPVGALETELAQSIAEDHGRLKRARAIETGIFAAGVLGQLGHLYGGVREDAAQVPIDEALSKAHTWIAKGENFQLLVLMSSASTAPLRRIWLSSVPCGRNAKPPVNRRSKKPNCLPSSPTAKAKSTIRPGTSRPKFCKLAPNFRPQA
jgi:hypothetical protein